jgi:lipopolysaccharide transport system permease protein
MQLYSGSTKELVASLWLNRRLLSGLTKREIVGRYRGSFLGIMWSFFNPLFMLAVYTFVFSVVFKVRWSGGGGSKVEFALALFAGMIVFNLFSECINRSPGLIVSNVNYVKKVVFPLEVLPWVTLGAATFHMLISLSVWLMFYIVFFGVPHWTLLLLPLVILPLLLMTAGFCFLLAALGVYLRDVSQVVTVATTALLFLSPIFYPISALPPAYQTILHLNPLTSIIEQTRAVLIMGTVPDPEAWAVGLGFSIVVAWMGFFVFQKTRRGFADVL